MFWMVFIAVPFRAYARNVVYNYHLNNGIALKRLSERKPKLSSLGNMYYLDGGTHSSQKGLIKKRDVSRLHYLVVLWTVWLWLDDDSNEDTFDKGFNKTIVEGQRKKWMPNFIKKKLAQAIDKANMTNVRGNSFDLGDVRSEYPLFEFWSVLLWTVRNPAYNFNYKFHQMVGSDKAFKVVLFGRIFGWDEDGTLNGVQTYSWECGKLAKRG